MKSLNVYNTTSVAEAGFSKIRLLGLIPRFAAFLLLGVLIASSVYVASSASSNQGVRKEGAVSRSVKSNSRVSERLPLSGKPAYEPFMLAPSPVLEGIATYRADCVTPQTDFNLGDVVCAKATGVPSGLLFPYRVTWVDTAGFIRQSDPAVADDQATYTYTLPATATSVVNDQTVDNRGTWRVNLTRANGAIRQTADFVVHEVGNTQADAFVQKFQRNANDQVHAGENVAFIIIVGNAGPDTSTGVHLADSVPAGGTLFSFTQDSGPTPCTPVEAGGPLNDCVIASMTNGDRAQFTAIYALPSNATPGTYDASASVSTTSADPKNDNDTSTTQFVIQSGSGATGCELTCPSDITVTANTTEGGQSGAHVTYTAPASSGTCGSISSVPASGSFFPVGTTVVTATSETGGGQCSFTVTVEEATNTNITCPANIEVNADANCGATVTLGTPTATGTNVTITVSRSDGLPMYDCDTNGENCVRKTTDLPFSAGVTVVTWTAYSHDTPGPYANSDDEIAHRTGNASCQQTVTVNDVTPPTITAPNTSASADANCQAPVPDYSTIATVSDNCACASSDTSQICDSRQNITVTQSPAAGTLVGLGPHTITLTANDGSSNNGGAGNTTTINVTFTVNDTSPPTFTFVPPAVTAYTGAGATTCDTVVSDATLGTATASDNCSAVTITRSPSGNTFPVGTTTVVWTAKDAANNAATANQLVTVIDNTPPVISCPSSIVLEPTCPSGAVGTYAAPVATDNCPGVTTTLTAGLASGSVFPIGTTTVTYTANDAHGNSTSCSFTVTVLTPQAVLQNLINSVNDSSLTGTQKNGLLAKLNAALSAINSGQTNVACNKLSEFVNSVGTLISHGDITAAQGNAWIASAKHVQNTIGCTNNPCT